MEFSLPLSLIAHITISHHHWLLHLPSRGQCPLGSCCDRLASSPPSSSSASVTVSGPRNLTISLGRASIAHVTARQEYINIISGRASQKSQAHKANTSQVGVKSLASVHTLVGKCAGCHHTTLHIQVSHTCGRQHVPAIYCMVHHLQPLIRHKLPSRWLLQI
jgi:hypothetical protein